MDNTEEHNIIKQIKQLKQEIENLKIAINIINNILKVQGRYKME